MAIISHNADASSFVGRDGVVDKGEPRHDSRQDIDEVGAHDGDTAIGEVMTALSGLLVMPAEVMGIGVLLVLPTTPTQTGSGSRRRPALSSAFIDSGPCASRPPLAELQLLIGEELLNLSEAVCMPNAKNNVVEEADYANIFQRIEIDSDGRWVSLPKSLLFLHTIHVRHQPPPPLSVFRFVPSHPHPT